MISDSESGFLDFDCLLFSHYILLQKKTKLIDTETLCLKKGNTLVKALFWFVFPILAIILIKYYLSHGYIYTT